MKIADYAIAVAYIQGELSGFDNLCLYQVLSTYNAKTSKIVKISLKVNYTKDGSPLPDLSTTKLTKSIRKNLVERTVHFRGEECNMDSIVEWVADFKNEKILGKLTGDELL